MNVDLLHVIQKIDLDSGVMLNSILLRLPNGAEISLEIDEANLLTLIRAKRGEAVQSEEVVALSGDVHGEYPSQALPSPPSESALPRPYYAVGGDLGGDNGEVAAVFGGDLEVTDPPPPQPKQSPRGRQVAMNEFGYPMVPRGPDVREVPDNGANVDEDGVPSI